MASGKREPMNALQNPHFDSWICDARSGRLANDDIARLAESLGSSGERLAARSQGADLASTGGPGSISTLWAPAALVAYGATVAKLGVPGRPAGGVDVLMQLKGYRTDFGSAGAEGVLEKCGYVHLLAGHRFAPADAAMFAYRQQVGAQNVPELAIASLLAKKLASGTKIAGLEVRVAPHGNFGYDRQQATGNALRYCAVAGILGLNGVCFLTDGTSPQQPYLGRGEALLALSSLLKGTECDWLREHAQACEAWAAKTLGASEGTATRAQLRGTFEANIAAQGGAVDELHDRAALVAAGHSRGVDAWRSGWVRYDLGRLRTAILAARLPEQAPAFDDSVGLILLARPGLFVTTGDPLISVRCAGGSWDALRSDVAAAISIDQEVNVDGTRGPAAAEVIGV
jgi:thymidine phosphorylase